MARRLVRQAEPITAPKHFVRSAEFRLAASGNDLDLGKHRFGADQFLARPRRARISRHLVVRLPAILWRYLLAITNNEILLANPIGSAPLIVERPNLGVGVELAPSEPKGLMTPYVGAVGTDSANTVTIEGNGHPFDL